MLLERDVPRRGRRRRLWPSFFLLALFAWALLDLAFDSYARPEMVQSHGMIEKPGLQSFPSPLEQRPTVRNRSSDLDQTSTARRVLKAILEDDDANRGKNLSWEERIGDDVDVAAVEKLKALEPWMTGMEAEYVDCKRDASLDSIPDRFQNIFVASNLKDNAQILPNMIKQLTLFILEHPEIYFFVSIYESGSKDKTPEILRAFSDVLEILEIDHDVQFNGTLKRQPRQGRIEFLSSVRNAAIRPLLLRAFEQRWDRILFINDVTICSDDIHRLLLHDGDIVCGLDFVQHETKVKKKFRKGHGTEIRRQYYSERLKDIVDAAMKVPPSAQRWEDRKGATVDLAPDEKLSDVKMDFYDIWVSHDLSGHHFLNQPPFVENNSYARHRLVNGLPFPVQCCWNGAAVLNPAPFLYHGVEFRAAVEGECHTSECVLLCHDFQRWGYNKVVVDPGIWLTYTLREARMLNVVGIPKLKRVDWATVKNSSAMIDERFTFNRTVDCCNILKFKDIVDFKRCQKNYNFWNVSSALQRLGISESNSESMWRTLQK